MKIQTVFSIDGKFISLVLTPESGIDQFWINKARKESQGHLPLVGGDDLKKRGIEGISVMNEVLVIPLEKPPG